MKVFYEWISGRLRKIEIVGPDNPPIPSESAKRRRFNEAIDNGKKLFKKRKRHYE